MDGDGMRTTKTIKRYGESFLIGNDRRLLTFLGCIEERFVDGKKTWIEVHVDVVLPSREVLEIAGESLFFGFGGFTPIK